MLPPERRLRLLPSLLAGLLGVPLMSPAAGWASSLAAWRLSGAGLELRTTPEVLPGAFFQAGSPGQGPRVWVDLPGEPSRTRNLRGSGAITEVRIGRPAPDTTRIVIQFAPGIRLDPGELKLVGTARDRWRMEFRTLAAATTSAEPALPPAPATVLAEGDYNAPAMAIPRVGSRGNGSFVNTASHFPTSPAPLNPQGLPVVPAGRFKVVIDPGHGGPDPGAVGMGGLRETDVVLDVALQLARLLQARGVQVLMTRTSEVDVDLPPRVSLANSSRADAFVSLHANALSLDRPDVNGIESFYFAGAANQSRALAAALQQEMLMVSPASPDRGVRTARFFVIRRTVMPSTLVEMGFVTGSLDSPRLADPAYRRRMAMALAKGVLNFLQGVP